MVPVRVILFSVALALASAVQANPREFNLPNGLRLIVKEDHRAPTVVQQLWYRAGSMDEAPGITGVAHVLEHMMFKGTRRVGPEEFSRIVAEAGGRENAFTSTDYTVYFEQVHRDRLPLVMQAKAEPGSHAGAARAGAAGRGPHSARVAQLLDAILHHRRIALRYHSFSSNREKEYQLEPYRIVFAQGGLYLVAFVPEYQQLRTFAVERMLSLSVTEERFEPKDLPDDAFAHSLGVNQGTPERIEVRFEPRIARYVKERTWHPSQETSEDPDGTLTMRLNVCNDWALRSWILGFGPLARVISPPELATQILEEIEGARSQYVPRLDYDLPAGE